MKNKKSTLRDTFSVCAILCSMSVFSVSCSKVDLMEPNSPERVSNLVAEMRQGSREVLLRWDNPAESGQSGIQIIRDMTDVTNINEIINQYRIKKAPINVPVMYTVKAMYGDGRISEGQTVDFYIDYESHRASDFVALLVPDDYETSDDEKSAATWFQQNYVTQQKGIIIKASEIDNLDVEEQSVCWVVCDRTGIDKGWQNLPGNLASDAVIDALKSYAADGGSLFLTNHATQLSVAVGRIDESYAPGIFGSGEGGQNNDIWGTQPIIGNTEGQIYDHSTHAIYADMQYESGLYERSIYCFEGAGIKGDHNCMWDLNSYGLSPEPNVVKSWEEMTNSTVLGTWNHVVDYCCAGIIDFNPTTQIKGRILCVGLASYEWDLGGQPNSKQDQLELFTSNCLKYLN